MLVTGVFWRSGSDLADPDIWWHLCNAQYLVTNLRFPNFDTHSFTAAGSPWIDHEWLSELFYYAALRAVGLRGLLLVCAIALSAMLVGVFWLALKESDDPFASMIVTVVGCVLAMVGFGPRTQHFGWLCFVAMYALLLRFRSARRAPLWLLPPVFCVWINCHGGWVFGLVVYAIFVLAGLIPHNVGHLAADQWSRSELKKLMLAGLVSVAALFVNPYGYRLVLYPFNYMFHQKLNIVALAEEWQPVNFQDPRGKLVAAVLGVVFALAFIGRKRWRIDNALLTAFVLYYGVTHMRFLLLTGIVLPPILAPQLGGISSYEPTHEYRILNSTLIAIALGIVVFFLPSNTTLQSSIMDHFPVRAVAYLRANPQPGRIFNLDAWGGYLEWNVPQIMTFYDTRVDVFQAKGVIKDYQEVVLLKNTEETLDRYQVNYILYSNNNWFAYYLSKVPQWERIYSDDQAVIYRRAAPAPPCTLAPRHTKAGTDAAGAAFP